MKYPGYFANEEGQVQTFTLGISLVYPDTEQEALKLRCFILCNPNILC